MGPAALTLPSVEALASVPAGRLAAFALQLAALQAAVAVRLSEGLDLTGAAGPSARAVDEGADEYLTADEAASLLKVSPKWLYRRSGSLPFAHRLSRKRLLFSRRGLERYLAARKA